MQSENNLKFTVVSFIHNILLKYLLYTGIQREVRNRHVKGRDKNRKNGWDTSIPRVPLFLESVVKLLEYVLQSTYFMYEVFYEQTDGVAMGSHLSSVILDFYIQ